MPKPASSQWSSIHWNGVLIFELPLPIVKLMKTISAAKGKRMRKIPDVFQKEAKAESRRPVMMGKQIRRQVA